MGKWASLITTLVAWWIVWTIAWLVCHCDIVTVFLLFAAGWFAGSLAEACR